MGKRQEARGVRIVPRNSSIREKPIGQTPRRLADWLNPTGAKKVHSLVDKIYQMKNLELAWEKVRRNKGAGGVDGQSIERLEEACSEDLNRLHEELRSDPYRPQPVRQQMIPKQGQPGKERLVGIPMVYEPGMPASDAEPSRGDF
jgi:RNA-directed DNA polymerase